MAACKRLSPPVAFLAVAAAITCPAGAQTLPPAGPSALAVAGRCLVPTAAPAANGTTLKVDACANAPQWTFTAVAGGHTIRAGSLCLDGGASGTAPILWSCDGSQEQVWTTAAAGNGTSLENRRFARCLTADGVAASLAACAGSAAQAWGLPGSTGGGTTPTPTPPTPVPPTPTPPTAALPPATPSALAVGGGQCLVPASATLANGTTLGLGACTGAPRWTFTAATGGFTLRSGAFCIDGGASGTAPILWSCDGSQEQIWSAAAGASGSSLTNRRFGRCLAGAGATASLAACDGSAAQDWAVPTAGGTTPTPPTPAPSAGLPPAVPSALRVSGGQCLVPSSAAPGNGTALALGACAGAPRWTFTTAATGFSMRSGDLCLDGGASGTAPVLWSCDGSQEQIWSAAATSAGASLTNRRFGNCLAANGAATALAACAGSPTQSWAAFTGETPGGGDNGGGGNGGGGGGGGGGNPPSPPSPPPGETPPAEPMLLINRRSGSCLAVPNGAATAGLGLRQLTCRDGAADNWRFVATGGGYQLRNAATGLCAGLSAANANDGTTLTQQVCASANTAQLFRLERTDQWYAIVSASSNRCLSPRSANDNRDVNGEIVQWTCDRADPQRWTLSAAKAPGQWSPKIGLGLVPVAAATLPSGKILMWSANARDNFGTGNGAITHTVTYDPATNRSTDRTIATVGHDMFCPGISTLPDGRILIAGGQSDARTTIYDPQTDSWSVGARMNVGRGYNGMTTLSTGEALTVGGSWSGARGGKVAEVWSPATGAWRRLNNISGESIAATGIDVYRGDNYAWLFPMEGGNVFHAGPSNQMNWLRTAGSGEIRPAGRRLDDPFANNGNAVMYAPGRIAVFGGANDQTDAPGRDGIFSIDITRGFGVDPTVERRRPMLFARAFANTVILPDGQTVTVGGQNFAREFTDDRPVLVPELWNPETGETKRLPALSTPRTYHSFASLMLDGRVAVGGGGLCGGCGVNHPDMEILTPPYLLTDAGQPAPRPALTAAGTVLTRTGTLSATTDRPVNSFSLVRLSTVTHSANADQRRVPLEIVSGAGTTGYQLRVPAAGASQLLPGPWMLFALDDKGVPSVARIVRVQ